jgi:hypothetical protein
VAATIKITGITATCNGYNWTSEDDAIADFLNALLHPLGPSGSDPNPDATAAQEVINKLGGEMVHFDPTPPIDPNVVY